MEKRTEAAALTAGKALECAVEAAHAAGHLMRTNMGSRKKINSQTQHDIKLELDVRCQKTIERTLRKAFPKTAILGEEGVVGDPDADYRWVVDPIDGTVNFSYGIPHACTSIALQVRKLQPPVAEAQSIVRVRRKPAKPLPPSFETILGVVYDPFCDDLWTAIRGQAARLNGKVTRVSSRRRLNEAIVSIGFAKEKYTLERMLPTFQHLVHRVRKIRIMGAAALSLTYVASGRMDAYIEYGLRLWDIAAGGLIIECAGGQFWHEPAMSADRYRVIASNGWLAPTLSKVTV